MNMQMRRVGIRQFQQSFHKELKNLPFIVTKDGQDYCNVIPHKNDVTTVKDRDVVTQTIQAPPPFTMINIGRCEAPDTRCKGYGSKYHVTCMTDEGEKEGELFLCDPHLKQAMDNGMEVQEV